jgi:hypothetical protein
MLGATNADVDVGATRVVRARRSSAMKFITHNSEFIIRDVHHVGTVSHPRKGSWVSVAIVVRASRPQVSFRFG